MPFDFDTVNTELKVRLDAIAAKPVTILFAGQNQPSNELAYISCLVIAENQKSKHQVWQIKTNVGANEVDIRRISSSTIEVAYATIGPPNIPEPRIIAGQLYSIFLTDSWKRFLNSCDIAAMVQQPTIENIPRIGDIYERHIILGVVYRFNDTGAAFTERVETIETVNTTRTAP